MFFFLIGVTPVHIAAALVQSNVLSVICDKVGSEVLDIQDTVGLTALMHACAAGSEECVKYILKKKVQKWNFYYNLHCTFYNDVNTN